MSQAPDLTDLFGALIRALSHADIRWYVFGAQAVVAYGVPRLTADIDLTVEYPLDRVEDLAKLLESEGFARRVDDVPAFAARTRVVPMEHERTGLPVDVVIAGPGLEEEFLVRARTLEIGDLQVPFISPEDLVVSKILAGREKDREDVRGILRSGEPLELSQMRRLLQLLDEALDRGDLVAELDRLLSEIDNGSR